MNRKPNTPDLNKYYKEIKDNKDDSLNLSEIKEPDEESK